MQTIRADLSTADWRKSTYSNGQEACLEVADNWRKSTYSAAHEECLEVAANWRKSTYSDSHEECLEVADNIPTGVIPVRDSKNPAGPALFIEAGAWSAFVAALKAGGTCSDPR
ncbi:DUF397 domain-containing protein [Streptomyces sp. NPDC026206]|uniref:DUF397 domain-containing protein n=1 Tax=Streptomyces sp. NPDC026206 TaxID=3157089 RepID=UPI0033DB5AE8